ncbi:type IX secretion system membrane protein PorP/SprF [Paradesertivirga mongoliensis]|uniref:Type IX secretion system membrane protein PorP/SprF n=1 Tax=Paradesertivirga mongoliensis TaxID=2100740 RepID=A0ABW4ZMZ4_9SPHI|nr:type IX secretion system membrane protein PorP/SprF [Pedobacter mongoliensis]
MRKFRELVAFLTVMAIATPAIAQQKPHYTQYFQNMSVINPAVTGMYHDITVRTAYRTQWLGLESAPKTSYLTVSKPINIGTSRSGFVDYGVEEPATNSDKLGYLSSSSHHSIGLVALNDETGPINRTTVNFTYAYHINISDVANLAVGVGGGVNRLALNTSKLRFENPEEPLIADGGNIIQWLPDLNAGFYFYSANFFLGGSVQQALSSKTVFAYDFKSGKEVPHYFLTSGFRIWFKEDYSISPSVMLKYLSPAPLAYDLNLKIGYRNNLWVGGSYRKNDALAAMFGFNVAKTVSLGYSFDNSTSPIRNVSSGSHELVLGINF